MTHHLSSQFQRKHIGSSEDSVDRGGSAGALDADSITRCENASRVVLEAYEMLTSVHCRQTYLESSDSVDAQAIFYSLFTEVRELYVNDIVGPRECLKDKDFFYHVLSDFIGMLEPDYDEYGVRTLTTLLSTVYGMLEESIGDTAPMGSMSAGSSIPVVSDGEILRWVRRVDSICADQRHSARTPEDLLSISKHVLTADFDPSLLGDVSRRAQALSASKRFRRPTRIRREQVLDALADGHDVDTLARTSPAVWRLFSPIELEELLSSLPASGTMDTVGTTKPVIRAVDDSTVPTGRYADNIYTALNVCCGFKSTRSTEDARRVFHTMFSGDEDGERDFERAA